MIIGQLQYSVLSISGLQAGGRGSPECGIIVNRHRRWVWLKVLRQAKKNLLEFPFAGYTREEKRIDTLHTVLWFTVTPSVKKYKRSDLNPLIFMYRGSTIEYYIFVG